MSIHRLEQLSNIEYGLYHMHKLDGSRDHYRNGFTLVFWPFDIRVLILWVISPDECQEQSTVLICS